MASDYPQASSALESPPGGQPGWAACPAIPDALPELAGKIFPGSAAIADGLLPPAHLRTSAWQRVLHGIYADSALTITHEHRCLAVSR
jgi:hypothetical protein